ncbi:MAG: terminase small subunit [Caulobacter sp.]|nr:terminase small subunit [Caulobacter sp.]
MTPPAPPGLTARQNRFVQEFAVDRCAAAAARRAGYSPASAKWTGRDLLRHPGVRAALHSAPVVSLDRPPDRSAVQRELANLAFANLLDYVVVDAAGELDLDLTRLDRAKAAAVRELIIDQATDPRTGVVRKRVRFKLADKQAALTKMLAQAPVAEADRARWMAEGRAEVYEMDDIVLRNRQAAWRRGFGD